MTRTGRAPFFAILTILTLASAPPLAAQESIAGTVVDEAGSALPRAHVRLLDAGGVELARTFTDSRGEFRLAASPCDGCQVEASLGGFDAATAPAGTQPLRLVLAVGPIVETVVVSATRSETPTSQVGSAVTVFTNEEIEARGTPLLAELLRATPGATVVRSGGLGSVTSLFVRGGESSYNKVLLDGIPLNEPGGTFNFSNITTAHLERVEVVRGAHSALFGTDAMASVVQLVTRRADGRGPAFIGALETGSYDSQRGSITVGSRAGRLDGSAHVTRQRTDNRDPNNEFRNTTISLSGGAVLTPDVRLRAVARGELGRAGVPGQTAFGRPDLDAFSVRREGVGGVTLLHYAGRLEQRATYALTTSHQESTNLLLDTPFVPRFGARVAPFEFFDFPYDSRTDLRRHHASYQGDLRAGAVGLSEHVVTMAVDWDGERGVLGNRLAGTSVRASRDNVGISLQHQALWRRFSLVTGLRVEHNDSFGTEVVPRASLAYVVRDDTTVRANAGAGVKEPTLLQSFSPTPSFLGNPDLEPERARTFDVGVEQRLFHRRAKIELTFFHGRFDKLIATRTLSFSPFRSQYFNIGLSHARGTELAAEVTPVEGLRIRAGHTFLDSEVTRSTSSFSPVFAEGNELFRRPRHSGYLDVVWQRQALILDLHGAFVGRHVDSDFSSLEPAMVTNDGHGLWDAGASYRLARRLTVYGRVENLSDADYMEPLGYPAWRRSARAGLRVEF